MTDQKMIDTLLKAVAELSISMLRSNGIAPLIMSRGYLAEAASSPKREVDIMQEHGNTWIYLKEDGRTVMAWSFRDYRTIDDWVGIVYNSNS